MNAFIKEKVVSLEDALSRLKGARRIVTAMAAAEPMALYQALSRGDVALNDATFYCANPTLDYECFHPERSNCPSKFFVMFLTAAVRKFQGHGKLFYIPQHLSQWSRNLLRLGPIDVFWGVCTPPDERGFVSLGPGACYESEIRRKAAITILEVNPELPLTFGDTQVNLDEVDALVWSPRKLPTIERSAPTEQDKTIASYIAELIPDRATIQLGIGGIPNALGSELLAKKDLGVHTEMINDTMMDLFQAGVVTGNYKTIWPEKIVGSFAFGSNELYRFIDKNPFVELHPSSVVNDPYRIGRNYRMFSINTAVEIDITGQVCSESIGHQELSGVGGASETHIGAQRSEGGRGIIAMHSVTGKGQSKINFELQRGAKVSISRNDVDTVVTEFGVASLKGKSVRERATEIINIAHPNFRDELQFQARKYGYL